MANRITATDVKKLGPGKRLMDGELIGFGVRRQGDGPPVYFLRYRAGKGRNAPNRFATIGRDGSPWVAETARARAKVLLGLVADGEDPARAPEAHRRAISVGEMCDSYLKAAPTTVLPGKGRPKKPRSIETDRSNVNRHIKPLLGRRRVNELRPIDIERFQRDVVAGKTARREKTRKRGLARVVGGAGIAGRVVAVLGAIFSWAIREGIVTENPVSGVAKYKTQKRERYLTDGEAKRLGDTLIAAEAGDAAVRENPYAVAAIWLLALTPTRKSEIISMQWDWIDTERMTLRLPDSKTGARELPLDPEALHVLARIPRVAGSPYVFPSSRGESHFVGLQKVWSRIRERAGLKNFRIHDLRHNYASQAVMAGHSLALVGKAMGHAQVRTTERYAHFHDNPVRAVAANTASRIAAAMTGSSAVVVPIKSALKK